MPSVASQVDPYVLLEGRNKVRNASEHTSSDLLGSQSPGIRTLEREFCLQALKNTLWISKPEIFNSDQGAQFTSEEFTGLLEEAKVRISMDGRGRLNDNIYVGRLWRTIKYEEVYLHDYRIVDEARQRLAAYMNFYKTERLHETLGYRTPHEVYFETPVVPLELRVDYGTVRDRRS